MYTSAQDPLRRPLGLLEISPAWGNLVAKVAATDRSRPPILLICGPQSSGKSTISRYILNYMLSKATERRRRSKGSFTDDGVALLDLDPGQPEFSPPGELSLVHLRAPIFGPPFTHPIVFSESGCHLVRAHHLGAMTPKDDPDHYLACAFDLMRQYRRLLQSYPTCPLVINCSGWAFGSGLEVLTELILKLGSTGVIYMSETGPAEVVDNLSDATRRAKIPFHKLPSQPIEYTTRSSPDLRAMQSLSYFHLATPKAGHLRWNDNPITSMAPWVVSYAGTNQGIAGIMVLGDRQDPEFLSQLLNGSLVGVVAIEDYSAIPTPQHGNVGHEEDSCNNGTIYQYRGSISDEEEQDMCGRRLLLPALLEEHDNVDETDRSDPINENGDDHPSVSRTIDENLPYILSGEGTSTGLDPTKSHSLGLALVRGVDKKCQTLHLVTPIPEATIQAIQKSNSKIVLVRGRLDTPSWAYQEEYWAAAAAEKRQDGSEEGEVSEGVGKARKWERGVPWVRLLEGQEGKGRGQKVWRVRRNLRLRGGSDDGMSD